MKRVINLQIETEKEEFELVEFLSILKSVEGFNDGTYRIEGASVYYKEGKNVNSK